MRTIIRALGAVIACGTLVMGTGVAGAETGARGVVGAIAWAPCPDAPAPVECGTLSLPVDWSAPRGERFDLSVARHKADPAQRIGAMLIDPGGPGGSGVDFAFVADRFFSAAVLERFDIIGFDPRGVGRSHPVMCSAALLGEDVSQHPEDQAGFDRATAPSPAPCTGATSWRSGTTCSAKRTAAR